MMTHAHDPKTNQNFSRRAYSFSAASVLLAASLLLGATVRADEQQALPISGAQSPQVATQTLSSQSPIQSTAQLEQGDGSALATDLNTSPAQASIRQSDTTSEGASSEATVSSASQLPAEVAELPAQGEYAFKQEVPVKAEPKASAETLFTFEQGDEPVNYDQTLRADGYQWISYLGTAGQRRYLQLEALSDHKQEAPQAQSPKDLEDSELTTSPQRTGEILVEQLASGDFDIVVTNVSSQQGLKGVKIPVWTEADGQDDLIWYDGIAQPDGSYKAEVKLAKHKSARGLYQIHLYYDEADGKSYGVATSNHTVPEKTNGSQPTKQQVPGPTKGQYTFSKEVPVKAEPKADAETLFTFDQTAVPIYYDQRLEADGYQWLSYLSYAGERHYIQLDPIEPSAVKEAKQTTSPSLTVAPQANGDFNLTLRDFTPQGGDDVVNIAVWSDQQGQDDLVWYQATKQTDGNYDITVKLSDHKNQPGLYHIHAYAKAKNGSLYGVTTATTTILDPTIERTGKVAIQAQTNGDFDVLITDVSAKTGIKAIKIPVWSDQQGQDDMVWYQASQEDDGTYKATIKLSDHKNESGLYHIHVYYEEKDGKIHGLTATTTEVVAPVNSQELPAKGTYTFTADSPIRNNPDPDEPFDIYYEKGQQVAYDSLLEENGYRWLSYLSESGQRRYVAIAESESQSQDQPTLPPNGSYRFNKTVDVKDTPDISAPTAFNFYDGETINYDSIVGAQGRSWLTYVSRSGIRRYIPLS